MSGNSKAGLPGSLQDPRQLGALAVMHARQGRPEQAIDLLRKAIVCDPGIAELHNNLGMALYSVQRHDEAIAAYRNALSLRPGYALAHNNLGVALASLGRQLEAITAYQAALVLEPGYAEALSNLGSSLHGVDRSAEAVKRFREALAIRPDLLEARINLGHALSALGRPEEAVPCYEAELQAKPGDAFAHLHLATALREAGRSAQVIELCEKAVALAPDLAAAHAELAAALLESGRLEDARRGYQRAALLEPRRPGHLLGLARSTRFTPGHLDLGPILALTETIGEMSDGDQVDAHFALAKVLADIGSHQRSFGHQLAGNKLKRRLIAYDEALTLEQLRRIRQIFTAEFMASRRQADIASPHPVFIVGMPRSGSTLVEQILASHGQVFGAGEVDAFSQALRRVGLHTDELPFPDSVPAWTDGRIGQAASQYLHLLGKNLVDFEGRTTVRRITDKMLSNFRYAGLIHLMFPNARIIHTRREPVDTCLSCFSLQFASLGYTSDLGELGRYYAAYAQLMDHWRAVLPKGRMLEIRYETLVDDFEATARRIIAYCGLPWDDACLRFHETSRPVRTSSLTQVRQPIYRDSIARWRPDADVLQPLLAALPGGGNPHGLPNE